MSENTNKPVTDRPRRVRRVRGARRGGGFFFPILLIALGIIFLLRNMGSLPGDTWDLILRLWPLVLVLMGLDSLFTRQGVAVPTIFIAIGIVILLDNLNIVQWDIWHVILSLWPVLIVAIGLDLLVARRSVWGAILALILLAVILGGSLWVMAAGSPASSAAESEQVLQVLTGVERAVVQIDPAVADLKISSFELDEADDSTLVRGAVQMSRIGTLQDEFSVVGDTGYFSLSREGDSVSSPSFRSPDWVWDLAFNPQIPLEMIVNLGAGSIDMDLSALMVTDLAIDMGVGRTIVVLPDQEEPLSVRIQGAIGETIVVIPEQKAVRVISNTGLAAISLPDGYTQDENVYTYHGAGPGDWLELIVDQAIGKISIRNP